MKTQCPCCHQEIGDPIIATLCSLKLQKKRLSMAIFLAQNFGELVAIDRIAARFRMTPDTVKVHICHIRQAIYQTNLKIETSKGDGYRLEFMQDERRVA